MSVQVSLRKILLGSLVAAAIAAPAMAIISCGRACRITPNLPPEITKLPNTIANRITMPMI